MQKAPQSGSGEHQNLGAVSSFREEKGGRSTFQTKNIIGIESYQLCSDSLYFMTYMKFIV